jgi:hypothetical protein
VTNLNKALYDAKIYAEALATLRESIVKTIYKRVCFDQLAGVTCEHADCYALMQLAKDISNGDTNL